MASPVAHSLAGAVIYLAVNRREPFRWTEFLTVIVAANLADLDLLPGILLGDDSMFHRTFSHSLAAAALVTGAVLLVCYRITPDRAPRITLMVGLALLSQLLIDWLSYDQSVPQGIALFWPFDPEYYMSENYIFLNVRRDNLNTMAVIIHNFKAVGWEIAILGGPFLLLCWQRARRSRLKERSTEC